MSIKSKAMDKYQISILVVVIFVIALFVTRCWNKGLYHNERPSQNMEEYSYHFGFPTWGAINNSPWSLGWGGVRGFNPFMARWGPGLYPYGGRYYNYAVSPYTTNRCYTSSESDGCVPGYRKIGTDTDDDGTKDKWQCCRKWLW